ncbi:MAG: hypothetical protein H6926_02560 [Chromatiales bacterium]|nr:hypothetical protein [Chromatiales bacterium]
MELQYRCKYFRQRGKQRHPLDWVIERFDVWFEHLRAVARFRFAPDEVLRFEQFLFKPPWWKPSLYHASKADEAAPLRVEKATEVGHAYHFHLAYDHPDPGPPPADDLMFD